MFGVAIAGLLVNILVFWILTRGDSEHVNIKGAALHVMGDLLGSVGAVGAAIVIYLTGWTPIDPILSVVVSLLVLRSAWKLAAKSLHILLEGAPDGAAPGKAGGKLRYGRLMLMTDQDNDGFVSKKEMQRMMTYLGNPLTDQEVRSDDGDDNDRRPLKEAAK